MAGQRALVSFPFSAEHEDELDLDYNDLVEIEGSVGGVHGWVEVTFKGVRGKVPHVVLSPLSRPLVGAVGKAMVDFKPPESSGQFLAFSKGSCVTLLSRPPDGWNIGCSQDHYGLFPEGLVEFDDAYTYEDLAKVRAPIS
jgi:hypothetical protein